MASALDDVLVPGYLDGLADRPLDEVRTMRADCQDVETGLSLLRRLVQGRLDIVGSERSRRAEGGDPGDLTDLIARLPELLSDRSRPAGPGRLSQLLVPSELDPELESEIEAIAPAGRLGDLPSVSDDELGTMVEALEALERDVSARRRSVFERIDALQAEITRRYRDGEASVDALLE